MSLELRKKYRKITEFTNKPSSESKQERSSNKCPISPTNNNNTEREAKLRCLTTSSKLNMDHDDTNLDSNREENPTLQKALGPLVPEFKLLRESVNTVHNDYADLKKTISMQKDEIKQELTDKIEHNSKKLQKISVENMALKKENETLKTRMEALEQNQLINNVILTRIKEGLFEPYSMK